MSEEAMFSIKVPASTANLGPGFDSIGLALALYLEVRGSFSERWEVIPLSEDLKVFPADETNYIVSIAKKVAEAYNKELRPCRMTVCSDIPLTRGLGSSASAIVAGIELANIAGNLHLSAEEKIRHASLLEGHPDNAGASVTGGLVVGWHSEEETHVISYPLEGIKVIAVIPDYELRTDDSRNVLPKSLGYQDAVLASASANVLLTALLTRNWELAGAMMKKDRFHQPYRSTLVPHLSKVEEAARDSGAVGTALSGAGPTVLCLVEEEKAGQVLECLVTTFPAYTVQLINIDNEGSKAMVFAQGDGIETSKK
ncbi:homoserine kinase [Peribacillus sp. FSL H8-0477]|uniref:homoserine kinase n=1 Tax=Peribacillus sp. FSL H8-0477 TaxID=2921388 RepID=UPI0030F89622